MIMTLGLAIGLLNNKLHVN